MQVIPTETKTQPQMSPTGPPPISPWAIEAVQPSHWQTHCQLKDAFGSLGDLTAPDVQTAIPNAVQKLNRFWMVGVWPGSMFEGA